MPEWKRLLSHFVVVVREKKRENQLHHGCTYVDTNPTSSLLLTCVCDDDDGECGARVSLSIQIMICHFQVFRDWLFFSFFFYRRPSGVFQTFLRLFTATCHQLLLRRDNSHANNNNNNNNNEECRGKMRRAPAHFVGYSSAKIVKMQPLVKYAKARCCCCCCFCVYGIRWKAFLLGNPSISPSLFSCQLFFSFLTSGNFCIAVRKRKKKTSSVRRRESS